MQCPLGRGKVKKRGYIIVRWTKEEIRPDHLYWPMFGSFDDWMCQALNIYVNSKESFDLEESHYVALWRGVSVAITLYPLKTKNRRKVEEKEKPWEPLDNLPPPYQGQGLSPPLRGPAA